MITVALLIVAVAARVGQPLQSGLQGDEGSTCLCACCQVTSRANTEHSLVKCGFLPDMDTYPKTCPPAADGGVCSLTIKDAAFFSSTKGEIEYSRFCNFKCAPFTEEVGGTCVDFTEEQLRAATTADGNGVDIYARPQTPTLEPPAPLTTNTPTEMPELPCEQHKDCINKLIANEAKEIASIRNEAFEIARQSTRQ
mmetsp:Transcript_2675/g.5989  ORF Transcript_2675/g.5989 Transcript_2675/m.5989 type:complete len:196 (-) Transcript_2675:62-649(-)|eukprot:CAMPEP_0204253718 /NCGR_PEP_ID=MMETSP0468-20130131/2054_1 /ASSEMBLY_ACC=CAM_ASM_000383 /TAXON_ID=2969 /ORGANISM="Oxyrrhis marina" /LENGTH=195 /DNA_ID=CAMNT_0051227323 /DNA_START=137 /DNA_END=724 /DNA_ORIENTATION=-